MGERTRGAPRRRFPELEDNQQRGSKPRCHLLTDGTRAEVAGRLTGLTRPFGVVASDHEWRPAGFERKQEVRLDRPNPIIPEAISAKLKSWWMEDRRGGSPHWDIASQCVVGAGPSERQGVLLVEAKAHWAEVEGAGDGKPPPGRGASDASRANHERIGSAIAVANDGLRSMTSNGGWRLSRDRCYQLSNRFAWAWKLVGLGVPVILVYVGFLDATEMSDEGSPFSDHDDWQHCVMNHAKGLVPGDVWGQGHRADDGTPFVPRIVSVRQPLTAARFTA